MQLIVSAINIVHHKHLSSSWLFSVLTAFRSGCSKPDKFAQRAAALNFFFLSPLVSLLKIQHRFYRLLLWSGYRIEQSLYNIHDLCAINDRMQVLWILHSAYMAMF